MSSQGYGLKVDGGGYTGFHIDLEVRFADRTEASVSRKEKKADVGAVVTGQIVPVRYDADDHSKVELDTAAMKAHRAAAHEATRASAIARAEAELANPTPPGATADELRNLQAGDQLPSLDQIRRASRNQ